MHNRCPDISRLYTLSETSVSGVPLYVLEFSDVPGKHQLMEPEMKYIGNMHGNEVGGQNMFEIIKSTLSSDRFIPHINEEC